MYEILFIGLVAGVAATYSAIADLAVNRFTVPCYVNPDKACPRWRRATDSKYEIMEKRWCCYRWHLYVWTVMFSTLLCHVKQWLVRLLLLTQQLKTCNIVPLTCFFCVCVFWNPDTCTDFWDLHAKNVQFVLVNGFDYILVIASFYMRTRKWV